MATMLFTQKKKKNGYQDRGKLLLKKKIVHKDLLIKRESIFKRRQKVGEEGGSRLILNCHGIHALTYFSKRIPTD